MVAHTFKARQISRNSRPAWSSQGVPGQQRLLGETLFQKKVIDIFITKYIIVFFLFFFQFLPLFIICIFILFILTHIIAKFNTYCTHSLFYGISTNVYKIHCSYLPIQLFTLMVLSFPFSSHNLVVLMIHLSPSEQHYTVNTC